MTVTSTYRLLFVSKAPHDQHNSYYHKYDIHYSRQAAQHLLCMLFHTFRKDCVYGYYNTTTYYYCTVYSLCQTYMHSP